MRNKLEIHTSNALLSLNYSHCQLSELTFSNRISTVLGPNSVEVVVVLLPYPFKIFADQNAKVCLDCLKSWAQ